MSKYTTDEIRLSIDYSRNYATARPDTPAIVREHILGLCDRLQSLLDERIKADEGAEKCFCDRTYPDSNPDASCGDCPTRDYKATQPTKLEDAP